MKINWSEEELTGIINIALNPSTSRTNKTESWIIILDNERYCTPSGKAVWNRKNHAMAAFNNHMKNYIENIAYQKIRFTSEYIGLTRWEQYNIEKDSYKECIEELVKSGRLKVLKLTYNPTEQ